VKITKASSRTALRDIEKLIAAGAIEQEEAGGRSTSYPAKEDYKNPRAGLTEIRAFGCEPKYQRLFEDELTIMAILWLVVCGLRIR
jgi:predicted DNA-binding transcriptional regulator YafY